MQVVCLVKYQSYGRQANVADERVRREATLQLDLATSLFADINTVS